MKKIHNIYDKKRCFIIGNGPSLSVEDLESLKGEICFSSHRIYKIFNLTKWRPQFYCAQDYKLINQSYKDINNIDCDTKFICVLKNVKYKNLKKCYLVELNGEEFYPKLPKFSDDISKCVYEGYTVTYALLQIAIYMGFKEIYLLGVDHSYSVDLDCEGKIVKNDIKDHFSAEDIITSIPQTYKSTLAYKAAKEYAEKNDIKIYNATRGGQLEIFERVNFNKIIKGERL